MAVYLDLENIAIGAHDAQFPAFDISKVIERLLLKGHIVVKKAYCDFERYKTFKRNLHEAAFELIEIPHVRQSGKNSADIRMVVDALDLCYTKSHVDTFVIISGDSDFSPLVSKLRENNKNVIGMGVKKSTSDLFINNCDEFLYYDDLVRAEQAKRPRSPRRFTARSGQRQRAGEAEVQQATGPSPDRALELVSHTIDALRAERGEDYEIRGSLIKQTIKRRNPGFNERAHGFRAFNDLLLEARSGPAQARRGQAGRLVHRARRRLATARDVRGGTISIRRASRDGRDGDRASDRQVRAAHAPRSVPDASGRSAHGSRGPRHSGRHRDNTQARAGNRGGLRCSRRRAGRWLLPLE